MKLSCLSFVFLFLFCIECLVADDSQETPQLRSLSLQQLLEICEKQSITTNDFFNVNHYNQWSLNDYRRVLGNLYLVMYQKDIKIDKAFDEWAHGGKLWSRHTTPNIPAKDNQNHQLFNNLTFLENMMNDLFFNPNVPMSKENVYRNYDGANPDGELKLPDFAQTGMPVINLMDFPDLDGSTSTKPLRIALAAAMFNLKCDWKYGTYASSSMRFGDLHHFPQVMQRTHSGKDDSRRQKWAVVLMCENGFLPNNQTVNSWITLTDCHKHHYNCLVINAVSPELVHQYNPQTTIIRPSKYESKIIGYDALVAVANVGNPCQNLTIEDINAIYRRKIKNWDKLTDGQMKGKITPIWRNIGSGTGILMAEMIFGKELSRPKDIDGHEETIMTMTGLIQRMRDPSVIGFSFYFYEHRIMPRPYVKTLAINGIQPSYKTIADGSYPLRAPIVAAIHKDTPANAPARLLYDFLSTPNGQQVVQAAGYVPLGQ